MEVNQLDENEKHEIWKNRIIYSLPVRLGNWNEDLALQESKHALTYYKRENCQLIVQKMQKMFKNLLKPVDPAIEGPNVVYGKNYQLVACDLPNTLKPQTGYKAMHGLYLSALLTEHDIDHTQHLRHGCGLTASPERSPCVRNIFCFEGCDQDLTGRMVNYGEDVYIRVCESESLPLYVQCECATIDNFGGHLTVRLTQSPDIYCRFKMLHIRPDLRYETMGTGLPPNTKMIIQHTASGFNLAAEYPKWMLTFFGAECTLTCHTFKNVHKLETAENVWKIVGHKKPDINLYVRAAKGEEIPYDLLV